MPRTTFKGQALTDFVAKFTYLTTALGEGVDMLSTSMEHKKDDGPTDLNNVWSLIIDGSSNLNGSDASVILESPIGEKISYALRLEFPTSNKKPNMKLSWPDSD